MTNAEEGEMVNVYRGFINLSGTGKPITLPGLLAKSRMKHTKQNDKLMYITLTNSKSKRKTIINWEQVHSCYELLDKESRSRVTKINFSKDSYIIVLEKLEEIHGLLGDASFGLSQKVEWDAEPDFDDMVEDSYSREFNREKNYNRY